MRLELKNKVYAIVNIKDNVYLTWKDTDINNFNSYQPYYFPFYTLFLGAHWNLYYFF